MQKLCAGGLGDTLHILASRQDLGKWLWGIYGLVIVLLTISDAPTPGNVCKIYFQSGADLLAGKPLYSEPYFMYFPTAAFFFVPFALAPFSLMASLWRLTNLAVYCTGIFSLTRMERTIDPSPSFIHVSAIVCLLSTGASKHGQMTLAVAGLLMLAAVNFERSHNWYSSSLMALSFALKPIVLPFLLLAATVNRAVAWRAMLFALILAFLPFVIQTSSYVLDQYMAVPRMLLETLQRKDATSVPSLIGLLEVVGVSLGDLGRVVLRALFAAGAFIAYTLGRLRLQEAADRSLLLYGISVGYILLLSPATEHNTYALLAPVVGVLLCLACDKGQRGIQLALGLVVLSGAFSHSVTKLFAQASLAYWIKPIGAVLTLVILTGATLKNKRRPPKEPKMTL